MVLFLDIEAVPPQVQALCSIAVWYSPAISIIGYDVRFYHPQLDMQNVIRRVGANQTFYIVQDEDKMIAEQEDLYVQVIKVNKDLKSRLIPLTSFMYM